jgi:hypothetical protein
MVHCLLCLYRTLYSSFQLVLVHLGFEVAMSASGVLRPFSFSNTKQAINRDHIPLCMDFRVEAKWQCSSSCPCRPPSFTNNFNQLSLSTRHIRATISLNTFTRRSWDAVIIVQTRDECMNSCTHAWAIDITISNSTQPSLVSCNWPHHPVPCDRE